MDGKQIGKSVGTVMTLVILIVVAALIVGTLLNSSAFSGITIINTTTLTTSFGSFLSAIFGFFALAGTVIAIVWIVGYLKSLFDKKNGLGTLAA